MRQRISIYGEIYRLRMLGVALMDLPIARVRKQKPRTTPI
jgi:hypothetical protein